MANWSSDLQRQLETSRDEPELEFNDLTFDRQDFQPPFGSLPDHQDESFDSFMARGSAPVPVVGSGSAPGQIERMTPFDSVGGSAGAFTSWSFTSSPVQDVQNSFEFYQEHQSPMLGPFTASQGHQYAVPLSSSLNDHLTSFSFGSANSDPMDGHFGAASLPIYDSGSEPMSRDELSSFFLGADMMSAVLQSPTLHSQDSSFDSWAVPMELTPSSSPSLRGQVGSIDTASTSAGGSGSVTSPIVSPQIMPQRVTASNFPSLDLPVPAKLAPSSNSPQLTLRDPGGRNRVSKSSKTGMVHTEAEISQGGKGIPMRDIPGNKRPAGRKGPLETKARAKAGRMRVLGACDNCRARKSPCDPGIYCRSCIRHYGENILRSPCRGKVLSDLTKGLMRDGIFPTHRPVENFLPAGYSRTSREIPAKLIFGFGPSIPVQIRIIIPQGDRVANLTHNHLMYQWPPEVKQLTERRQEKHDVFPAVLSNDDTQLRTMLEQHLTLLVDEHFDSFPRHKSQLTVLPSIYKFYKKIPKSDMRDLLGNCLRLLVLVHIGGDFQMDAEDPSCRNIKAHLVKAGFLRADGDGGLSANFETCPRNMAKFPVPCFIRGQFGKVMPQLASDLMADILHQLERLCLTLKCELWVPVLAAFAVLIMALESIDYHAKKVSFHASFDHSTAGDASSTVWSSVAAAPVHAPATPGAPPAAASGTGAAPQGDALLELPAPALNEQSFNYLLRFYHACFPSCHSQLTEGSPLPGSSSAAAVTAVGATRKRSNSAAAAAVAASGQREAQHDFLAELRSAMGNAAGYVEQKGRDARTTSEDLSFFFDRKLARFLLNLEFGV